MWFSLARLALKTGSEVYKNRKETRVLQSIAEKKQMQRVIDGEIEMVNTVNDPEIIIKLDAFFEQVNKFPLWLQGLIIGGYSSVLGIKGVSAFKKK